MKITLSGDKVISILCVDDELFVLEILEKFFERESGFSVKTCLNATNALGLLSTQEFDVVIADFGLPDMDGINLLRETRRRGFSGLFIILTGKHRAHVAIDALNNGGDYYVQKGAGIIDDINTLVAFIRGGVGKIRADRALHESECLYRSIVENHADLICRLLPNGEIRFVNDSLRNFIGIGKKESRCVNFYSLIPEEKQERILEQLQTLSPQKPEIVIEHAMRKSEGISAPVEWNYHAIFNPEGDIAEWQIEGRESSGLEQIHETNSSKIIKDAVLTLQITTIGTKHEDEWNNFTKTIDALENPVFAIDKTGVIIIWNKAIEQLTGVRSGDMVGKGNREYSIPFFGKRRPMLVDYIVISTDKRLSGKLPGIKRVGNTFIGEMEKVKIREKPMFLSRKGTAVHDGKGELIAAIEIIEVTEQPQEGQIPA